MTKTPFTSRSERASDQLALIHTNMCGLMSMTARGGFQYFITFTDDFTNRINLMIKFIHKYTDKNNLSVSTDRIMNDITVGLKKANCMVM